MIWKVKTNHSGWWMVHILYDIKDTYLNYQGIQISSVNVNFDLINRKLSTCVAYK